MHAFIQSAAWTTVAVSSRASLMKRRSGEQGRPCAAGIRPPITRHCPQISPKRRAAAGFLRRGRSSMASLDLVSMAGPAPPAALPADQTKLGDSKQACLSSSLGQA